MANSNVTVDLQKLEKLLNKVGDLVITNSMMSQSVDNLPNSEDKKKLLEKIALLQRHIVELQDYATDIRMIRIDSMYSIYDDLVKEILPETKAIRLEIIGGDTKVDKSILEQLDLSIKRLISNAVIHGIETKEERNFKEKNPEGVIKIIAQQTNGQIHITVEDDGKGIEDIELLHITSLKEIVEKLNGIIEINSQIDEKTSITIKVPLTHSILDGLNIKIGEALYILPTSSIVESIQATKDMIKYVGDGTSQLLMLRNEFIPILKLYKFLNITPKSEKLEDGILIVVKSGTQKAAFLVDEFLQQQQVVVKAIETNYKKIPSVAGATVRGDGSIGIIIDVKSIMDSL